MTKNRNDGLGNSKRKYSRILLYILNRKWIRWAVPSSVYLKVKYYFILGKRLHLSNPRTFNEKLQWLKIHNKEKKLISLVDKYAVREYVAQTIGDSYLVPLVGGPWRTTEEICFEKLPNSFVLKATHDSGSVCICRNKQDFDFDLAKKKLNICLKRNYYWFSREWPYKHIRPQIVAEKYIEDFNGAGQLSDYKFMVFNGVVKCLFVCSERFSSDSLKVDFFDLDWNHLPFERKYPNSKEIIKKPRYLNEMVCCAKKLAQGLTFARIDFYELEDRVYFSEITLFPGGGFEGFSPDEWDHKLGDWLDIKNKNDTD